MDAEQFQEKLESLKACSDARNWAKGKSLTEAWDQCENPRWMLWLLGKTKKSRKVVVTIAVEFAESVAHHAAKYPAVAECIAVTKKWIAGDATIEEVRKARAAAAAAYAAAYAAAAAAAAAAAYAAAAAAADAAAAY